MSTCNMTTVSSSSYAKTSLVDDSASSTNITKTDNRKQQNSQYKCLKPLCPIHHGPPPKVYAKRMPALQPRKELPKSPLIPLLNIPKKSRWYQYKFTKKVITPLKTNEVKITDSFTESAIKNLVKKNDSHYKPVSSSTISGEKLISFVASTSDIKTKYRMEPQFEKFSYHIESDSNRNATIKKLVNETGMKAFVSNPNLKIEKDSKIIPKISVNDNTINIPENRNVATLIIETNRGTPIMNVISQTNINGNFKENYNIANNVNYNASIANTTAENITQENIQNSGITTDKIHTFPNNINYLLTSTASQTDIQKIENSPIMKTSENHIPDVNNTYTMGKSTTDQNTASNIVIPDALTTNTTARQNNSNDDKPPSNISPITTNYGDINKSDTASNTETYQNITSVSDIRDSSTANSTTSSDNHENIQKSEVPTAIDITQNIIPTIILSKTIEMPKTSSIVETTFPNSDSEAPDALTIVHAIESYPYVAPNSRNHSMSTEETIAQKHTHNNTEKLKTPEIMENTQNTTLNGIQNDESCVNAVYNNHEYIKKLETSPIVEVTPNSVSVLVNSKIQEKIKNLETVLTTENHPVLITENQHTSAKYSVPENVQKYLSKIESDGSTQQINTPHIDTTPNTVAQKCLECSNNPKISSVMENHHNNTAYSVNYSGLTTNTTAPNNTPENIQTCLKCSKSSLSIENQQNHIPHSIQYSESPINTIAPTHSPENVQSYLKCSKSSKMTMDMEPHQSNCPHNISYCALYTNNTSIGTHENIPHCTNACASNAGNNTPNIIPESIDYSACTNMTATITNTTAENNIYENVQNCPRHSKIASDIVIHQNIFPENIDYSAFTNITATTTNTTDQNNIYENLALGRRGYQNHNPDYNALTTNIAAKNNHESVQKCLKCLKATSNMENSQNITHHKANYSPSITNTDVQNNIAGNIQKSLVSLPQNNYYASTVNTAYYNNSPKNARGTVYSTVTTNTTNQNNSQEKLQNHSNMIGNMGTHQNYVPQICSRCAKTVWDRKIYENSICHRLHNYDVPTINTIAPKKCIYEHIKQLETASVMGTYPGVIPKCNNYETSTSSITTKNNFHDNSSKCTKCSGTVWIVGNQLNLNNQHMTVPKNVVDNIAISTPQKNATENIQNHSMPFATGLNAHIPNNAPVVNNTISQNKENIQKTEATLIVQGSTKNAPFITSSNDLQKLSIGTNQNNIIPCNVNKTPGVVKNETTSNINVSNDNNIVKGKTNDKILNIHQISFDIPNNKTLENIKLLNKTKTDNTQSKKDDWLTHTNDHGRHRSVQRLLLSRKAIRKANSRKTLTNPYLRKLIKINLANIKAANVVRLKKSIPKEQISTTNDSLSHHISPSRTIQDNSELKLKSEIATLEKPFQESPNSSNMYLPNLQNVAPILIKRSIETQFKKLKNKNNEELKEEKYLENSEAKEDTKKLNTEQFTIKSLTRDIISKEIVNEQKSTSLFDKVNQTSKQVRKETNEEVIPRKVTATEATSKHKKCHSKIEHAEAQTQIDNRQAPSLNSTDLLENNSEFGKNRTSLNVSAIAIGSEIKENNSKLEPVKYESQTEKVGVIIAKHKRRPKIEDVQTQTNINKKQQNSLHASISHEFENNHSTREHIQGQSQIRRKRMSLNVNLSPGEVSSKSDKNESKSGHVEYRLTTKSKAGPVEYRFQSEMNKMPSKVNKSSNIDFRKLNKNTPSLTSTKAIISSKRDSRAQSIKMEESKNTTNDSSKLTPVCSCIKIIKRKKSMNADIIPDKNKEKQSVTSQTQTIDNNLNKKVVNSIKDTPQVLVSKNPKANVILVQEHFSAPNNEESLAKYTILNPKKSPTESDPLIKQNNEFNASILKQDNTKIT
ncbi:metacaspase-2-like [Chrysoperla carnea]|uniref:metacaspase-2-like n=1 Tax=Chrysoperla carnea TaxID=189513 RepID=UPI001D09203A|nr:metacaspase-2-like [Chrysoperla carnea]